MDGNCIFCKIIQGQIPAKKAYEDEDMLIFHDIEPKAKKHYLMILKSHFKSLEEMSDGESRVLAKCLKKVGQLKGQLGLETGYRLIVNQGEDAGQTVFHLHVHILGGQAMDFPEYL